MNKASEVIELIREQKEQDQGEDCVCPECGRKEPHTKGTPCNQVKCPECDVSMTGADEKPKKKAPSNKEEPGEGDSEATDRYDAFGHEE